MSVPRGLSEAEQTAWAALAQSVTPLPGKRVPSQPATDAPAKQVAKPAPPKPAPSKARPAAATTARPQPAPATPRRIKPDPGLDSHWNRKLKAGQIAPDYTLDLHGHTLDAAYGRIMDGIDQARSMGARVVLVIAGRERPADPADRSTKRGAIRAKLLDWLAASHHADAIAAVRRAHIRHGGEGALYLVLRRPR
ncbi:DNA mismatch repair protein MutS [Erythrobacter sp. KY5]|uniref:Smr/MutS family protein n=1 Tax=Erythrobacter sp. KY5 TaxID=2011159 RepID=UPI000DBF266A|nr:Smr/MutS family protein [Erythrobacter sp. KY5]AWW75848.1 DNA mismatch repair protein MutS [Erythrobacter sp. KY5]